MARSTLNIESGAQASDRPRHATKTVESLQERSRSAGASRETHAQSWKKMWHSVLCQLHEKGEELTDSSVCVCVHLAFSTTE